MIIRRNTKKIPVGNLYIGGDSPVTIQSMTNTKTNDVMATIEQVNRLVDVGCDLVRITVPDISSVESFRKIKQSVKVPIIADIHFDYKLAIAAIEAGADKIRINPGNVGSDQKLYKILDKANEYNCPIRIGVNSGSVGHKIAGNSRVEKIVNLSRLYIDKFEQYGFKNIVLSLKSSDLLESLECYQEIVKFTDYPLHLGITEAGTLMKGTIKSSIGIGALLAQGIGDTIRVSLTDDPVEEVKVAKDILRFLGLRKKGVEIISCPTCGRTEIDIVSLAKKVESALENYDLDLKVAVMGCVVNGPQEAADADFGVAGGVGEGLIFAKGKIIKKVKESEIVNVLLELINKEIK